MQEINQITFGDVLPSVPHEQHLACVLLLDTSGSMALNGAIGKLNKAVNDFKEQTMMDELAQKRVDIAIVEFNNQVNVIQDFVPIPDMKPVVLNASGMTAMGEGINKAIDMVKDRVKLYANLGTPSFKPWIFMITDGAPSDEIEVAKQRIRDEESKGSSGKLKFWAIGVPGYDKKTLTSISKRCIAIDQASFTGIFNWLSQSMVAISASSVSENVPVPPIESAEGESYVVLPSEW